MKMSGKGHNVSIFSFIGKTFFTFPEISFWVSNDEDVYLAFHVNTGWRPV